MHTCQASQGPRYNFVLEGAMGIPDDERSELKTFKEVWGYSLGKFDTRLLRLALNNTNLCSSIQIDIP